MPLVLVGLSHHNASIEVREKLNTADYVLPHALASLSSALDIREAVILSTCNRMEVYCVTDSSDPSYGIKTVVSHLSNFHKIAEDQFSSHLYKKSDEAAVQHLLRVASGLDSLVLGEAQILGQVRSALRAAQSANSAGSILNALFQQAITSGKRVQTETGLGRGSFSIGHAAVDLARSIFSDISHATVLIVGAGKMSELTLRHLQECGVHSVVVANRTHDRALIMAEKFGGRAARFDDFLEELAHADIVITSTSSPHTILDRKMLLPVLKRRRGRSLFIIDIAVPRDVNIDVDRLDNVYLKNIDDLQDVVAGDANERSQEVEISEIIAGEESDKFIRWLRAREAAPLIAEIRSHIENIRQEELSLLRTQLQDINERDWQRIETMARSLTNKIAREPTLSLKHAAERAADGETALQNYSLYSAAREIFGLHSRKSLDKEDSINDPDVDRVTEPYNGTPDEETF